MKDRVKVAQDKVKYPSFMGIMLISVRVPLKMGNFFDKLGDYQIFERNSVLCWQFKSTNHNTLQMMNDYSKVVLFCVL
jgi:hypothetical protein